MVYMWCQYFAVEGTSPTPLKSALLPVCVYRCMYAVQSPFLALCDDSKPAGIYVNIGWMLWCLSMQKYLRETAANILAQGQ